MMLFFFYLRFGFRYLRYYFQAATKYDVHSPFVADFVHYILEDERLFYVFPHVERMRARLLRNTFPLEIIDLGAGSQANRAKTRTVRNVVRYGAVSPRDGQRLFRLAAQYKPRTIVELGTSLGISTLYLAGAAPNGQVITLEGCPDLANVAQLSFQRLEFNNISLRLGDFQDTFPQALAELPQLDFLYIDGDHRAGRAEQYVNLALDHIHEGSIIVLADIHWSKAMERCWETLRRHPKVRLSLDLFQFGVLFFRDELREPQHLSLIEWRLKPWRLGFFGKNVQG